MANQAGGFARWRHVFFCAGAYNNTVPVLLSVLCAAVCAGDGCPLGHGCHCAWHGPHVGEAYARHADALRHTIRAGAQGVRM